MLSTVKAVLMHVSATPKITSAQCAAFEGPVIEREKTFK